MTPRQLDRAVNAALSRILPPMVRALRDDLVTALRDEIAARNEAPLVQVQMPAPPPDRDSFLVAVRSLFGAAAAPEAAKKAEPWTVPVPVAEAEAEEPPPAPAATGPWTAGEGSRRRLTEAGLARVSALLAEGKTDSQIAAEMGITRRAVQLRRTNGTESAATWATTPQPDRDLARAEKNRQYQREWYRKRRAKGGQPGKAVSVGVDLGSKPSVQVDVPVPSPAPASQTVVVVPAAVVPAPRQPPVPAPALIVPPAPLKIALPTPPAPAKLILPARPRVEPEVIPTTPKEVRAWLIASMKAGGLTLVQAQDRVGFMTHDQALAEANQRRARAGYPPFAFLGARSAA